MDLSIPAPESQRRALVAHVKPKVLLNTNVASDDSIVLSKGEDDVLGESGLEDLFNNGGDQSFTNNINDGPVDDNRMNVIHLPSWGKLDHVAREIILKTLSDGLGSFQAACKTLSLEPNEAEAFLERHEAERDQAAAWRRDLNKPAANGGAPDAYDGPEATGPVHVEQETIARACAWLGFLGLDELSDRVSRWARRTTPWPLGIRCSDFNPMGLGVAHEDLPGLIPAPADESARPATNAEPRLEDDSRVFVAFRATEQQQRPGVFRIHSILLPEGAIVVGPDGVKELLFGGRYRLCYADNGPVTGAAAADEFLICANHTQRPRRGGRARCDDDAQYQLQLAPEHIRTANTPSPRADDGKGKAKETNPPRTRTQSSATVGTAAISDDVLALSQSGTSDPGIKSPQGETQFFTSAATGLLSSPDLHETKGLHVAALGGPVYHRFASQPNLGLENAFSPGVEGMFPKLSLARSQNPQGPPHHGANETRTQAQTRLAYKGAAAAVLGMVRDGPTIEDSSVLRDLAIEPQQQQQRHPGAGPFHDNANVFGPPRKQKIPELVGLAHRCRGGRVLFQFRLPAGYRVLSPAGYAMNFDDGAKQGPNDGVCPGGVGGLYTVILRAGPAAAAAPGTSILPMVPELDDRVDLRMNLPERMVVFRNKRLLPRLTEMGFHDISVVQTTEGNKLDLVCENGRYQIFRDMLLSNSESFMLGQLGKMALDDPDVPTKPFISAQVMQRPNSNDNAESEPMDVDMPVEEGQANTGPDVGEEPAAEALRYLASHREWLDAEEVREKNEEYHNMRRSLSAQHAQRMAEREAAAEAARHERAANPLRTTRGRVVNRPAGFQGTFNWAEDVSSMGESSSSSEPGGSGTKTPEGAHGSIKAASPMQSATNAPAAPRKGHITSTSIGSEPEMPVLKLMGRPDSRASSSQRGNPGSSRGSLPPSRDALKSVSDQSQPRARSGRTTETANDSKVSRSQQPGSSREPAAPKIKLVPQKRSLRGALSQQDGASPDTSSTEKGKGSVVEPSPKRLRTGKPYEPRAQKAATATVAAPGKQDAEHMPVSQPDMPTPTEPPKRRRGRPRKYPLEAPASSEGKPCGRPQKAPVSGTDSSEANRQLEAALAMEPVSSTGERSGLGLGRGTSSPTFHGRGGDASAAPGNGEGEDKGEVVPSVLGRGKVLSIFMVNRQHTATASANREAGNIDSDETEVEDGEVDANGRNEDVNP
ncbi:hypothetical protein DL764_008945 [Monosporascus ibericus]|uniref:Uncharacterized protein n=1 Tax=Monosporascus ibericus TaxID=155417 RepID=A0A4Q4SWB1_9PEZI|nr:hypothetical protein DL764_008945 [Monosporascus ibericus]